MKEKTCFKIPRSTRTDLFSTNSPDIFQNTLTFSTRLADFHKIIITVLNFYFLSWKWSKRFTGIIRNSVKFVLFGADLALSLDTAQKRKFYIKNFFFFEQWDCSNKDFHFFEDHFMKTLNRHAPMKNKKYIYPS